MPVFCILKYRSYLMPMMQPIIEWLLLSNYLVQTLVPTATPEPMPEFTPSPAETPSPMPTEVPVEKTEKPIFSTPQIVAEPVAQDTNGRADPIHIILLASALLMLAGGIAIVILLRKRK